MRHRNRALWDALFWFKSTKYITNCGAEGFEKKEGETRSVYFFFPPLFLSNEDPSSFPLPLSSRSPVETFVGTPPPPHPSEIRDIMGNSSAVPARIKKSDEYDDDDDRTPQQLEDGDLYEVSEEAETEDMRAPYPDGPTPPPAAGRLSETYAKMNDMATEREEGYPYQSIVKCIDDNTSLFLFCKMMHNAQSDDIVFNCDLRALFPRLTFEIKYVPSDSTNPSYEYTYGDPTGTWTEADKLRLARQYDPGEDVYVRMEGHPEEDELEYREGEVERSGETAGEESVASPKTDDAHPDLRNRRDPDNARSDILDDPSNRTLRSFAVSLQTSSLYDIFLSCRAVDGTWKTGLDEREKDLKEMIRRAKRRGTTSASLSCDLEPESEAETGPVATTGERAPADRSDLVEDLPHDLEYLRKLEDELEWLSDLRKRYGDGLERSQRYCADQRRALSVCELFLTAVQDRERLREPSDEGRDFFRIAEQLGTVFKTLKSREQEMCRWRS